MNFKLWPLKLIDVLLFHNVFKKKLLPMIKLFRVYSTIMKLLTNNTYLITESLYWVAFTEKAITNLSHHLISLFVKKYLPTTNKKIHKYIGQIYKKQNPLNQLPLSQVKNNKFSESSDIKIDRNTVKFFHGKES